MASLSELGRRRLLAGACVLGVIVLWVVAVPAEGFYRHFDHDRYLRIEELMHDGANYYDATNESFGEAEGPPSQARAYRQPGAFLFWRLFPTGWLYGVYLTVVVAGTCVALLFIARSPWSVVPVAFYLVAAGRLPGDATAEEWLLVELWCLPLLAGALLASTRSRWWPAAALAALAALFRETAAPVLLMGWFLAWRRGTPQKPWLVCGAAAAFGIGLHFAVVAPDYAVAGGTEAKLAGTGSFSAVLHMLDWILPEPEIIGLGLWVFAVHYLATRRRDLLLVAPLLGVPWLGLVVDRPYWGLLAVPFTVFLTAEAVAERVTAIRARQPVAAA